MNKKEQDNTTKQNQETKKYNRKITGLDIDKMEYQEIVLSYSNFPGNDFFRQNRYD